MQPRSSAGEGEQRPELGVDAAGSWEGGVTWTPVIVFTNSGRGAAGQRKGKREWGR